MSGDRRTENGLFEELETDLIPELADPYCNRDHPIVITPEQVILAKKQIANGVIRTPCTKSRLSERVGAQVYFKKEFMQYTGSFKDRGALNVLKNLTEEQRKRGVITTSAGNHAQSMAYQGAELGIPVTVVMPTTAPLVKVKSSRSLKATVVLHGTTFDEAKARALTIRNEKNMVYIDGYDHPDVLTGQGTAGLEIVEDVPDADYIIVPIGGGGLIAGVSVAAKHLNPNVKIIGVESDRCPSWHTAVKNGRPIGCTRTKEGAKQSLSDGLSIIRVGYNAFASAAIDKLITVPEEYFNVAILHLLEGEKAVIEGGGASSYAALLSKKLPEVRGKKVVCFLTGGNIDANVLTNVIDRALLQEGRLTRFTVKVSDRAGGLQDVIKVLAELGAGVKDIQHDRISLPSFIYMSALTCTAETRDREHSEEIRQKLQEKYGHDLTW